MKKILLALMLMLFLAPRAKRRFFKLGIRGGVNTGVYSFDDFILKRQRHFAPQQWRCGLSVWRSDAPRHSGHFSTCSPS